MFRFAIGLGINSLPGAQLERALAHVYQLDDFDIIPLVEDEGWCTENLLEVQRRAVEFAERAKYTVAAEMYFGVVGGQVRFCLETGGPSAPARIDAVAGIINHKPLPARLLDPGDIRRQLIHRVCALVSTERSISELLALIRKHCAVKALPKPF